MDVPGVTVLVLCCVAAVLLVTVFVQWLHITGKSNNRKEEIAVIEKFVQEFLAAMKFDMVFHKAMAEFVESNETNHLDFATLKAFYRRLCEAPEIYEAAKGIIERCRNAAQETFSEYCLRISLYDGGYIGVKISPFRLTLTGVDGSLLPEDGKVNAYTKSEVQEVLRREGVVTVTVKTPAGEEISGPLDVVLAKLS